MQCMNYSSSLLFSLLSWGRTTSPAQNHSTATLHQLLTTESIMRKWLCLGWCYHRSRLDTFIKSTLPSCEILLDPNRSLRDHTICHPPIRSYKKISTTLLKHPDYSADGSRQSVLISFCAEVTSIDQRGEHKSAKLTRRWYKEAWKNIMGEEEEGRKMSAGG